MANAFAAIYRENVGIPVYAIERMTVMTTVVAINIIHIQLHNGEIFCGMLTIILYLFVMGQWGQDD